MICSNLDIVHQGVDTLVIGINIIDEFVYNRYFKAFLQKLSDLKECAKNINSYGEKFIQSDLGLNLGVFLVSSKGIQNYKYLYKNNDIFVSVSDSSFEVKTMYHLKVQFRSHFLLKFGHKKAYEFVKIMLDRIFLDDGRYVIKILRFDLATDIKNIDYTPKDIFKFRSLRKITNYVENYDSDDLINDDEKIEFENFDKVDTSSFIRFSKFQGLSFGKNPAMFRIYDKIKEISQKQIAPLIFQKWLKNGFDFEKDKTVYRHECEFGRSYIQKIIPYKCSDEIKYFFDNIGSFWLKGLELCRYYPLTDDEISRILRNVKNGKSANNRQIYKRCLDDKDRFHFWDKLKIWQSDSLKILSSHDLPYIQNMEKPKKALKAFINSVYTNLGYAGAFNDVLVEVAKDLAKDGLTPHDYGMLKLASHFSNNEKLYYTSEFLDNDLRDIFNFNIVEFMLRLDETSNDEYKNIVKNALIFNDSR